MTRILSAGFGESAHQIPVEEAADEHQPTQPDVDHTG
jgi:hypothetical protein